MGPGATPVLFDPKKNGRLLFRVGYRKLNTMNMKASHPLQRVGECIDLLGDVKVFRTFNAYNSYLKVSIIPQDLHKTSFVLPSRHVPINKNVVRSNNAPATYQRAVGIF